MANTRPGNLTQSPRRRGRGFMTQTRAVKSTRTTVNRVKPNLSPSNWWHYQPFAAASTLSTARAIAELQVARKADAHFPQSLTSAVDGDAFGRQSIIRAYKRIDDLTGSDAQRGRRIGILLWNSHSFASPANEIEIFTRL